AEHVSQPHLEASRLKTMLRPARAMMLLAEEERLIAVHELGHALMILLKTPWSPLESVSVEHRGTSLGSTMSKPVDRVLRTASELKAEISVLIGGRAAEEEICGEPSTGAADDLRQALQIVRSMIADYGMG